MKRRKNDENDDEDAQEPRFITLVPDNILSSPTPFSLSSSPLLCFHGMKNQVLEQEGLTPHFVMLEEMDFSSLALFGVSLVWKEEEMRDLRLHPLKSLRQMWKWRERHITSQQEWEHYLLPLSPRHSIAFPIQVHNQNHRFLRDMVDDHRMRRKRRRICLWFQAWKTLFEGKLRLVGKLGLWDDLGLIDDREVLFGVIK